MATPGFAIEQERDPTLRRRGVQTLPSPRRDGGRSVAYMQMLQRTIGNRAVNQFLQQQAQRTTASIASTAVQRCAACAAAGHTSALMEEPSPARSMPGRVLSLLQREEDDDKQSDSTATTTDTQANDNVDEAKSSDNSSSSTTTTDDSSSSNAVDEAKSGDDSSSSTTTTDDSSSSNSATDDSSNSNAGDEAKSGDDSSNGTTTDGSSSNNAVDEAKSSQDDELLAMHSCELAAKRPLPAREPEESSCSCGCGGACQRSTKVASAAAADTIPAMTGFALDGPHAGSATIVCNGSGGYRVALNDWASAPCGIVGCIQKHEESHISDWMARYPNGAKNSDGTPKADGTPCPVGGDGYDAFLKRSECTAYGVEQPCEEALVAAATGDCKNKVQTVLDDTKRQKASYCS